MSGVVLVVFFFISLTLDPLFFVSDSIQEWEWKTIEALLHCEDSIPAPHCEEALHVYLEVFAGHADYADLLRMKNKDTPMDRTCTWWETPSYCMSAVHMQTRTREYKNTFSENEKEIRRWLKRWNAKQTTWSSRSRSSICKALHAHMGEPQKNTSPTEPLDQWFDSLPMLDSNVHAYFRLKAIESTILRRLKELTPI